MAYGATAKKMKRQGVRRKNMPKAHKRGAQDVKAEMGQNYADIIKKVAKKKGKM